MITVYNIRGTNGSGKSTLARTFIEGDPTAPPNRPGDENSPNMVDLTWYDAPTKKDPGRRRSVEGYVSTDERLSSTVIVVGSYRTACGGLDAVPNFDTSFRAITAAVDMLARLDVRHRSVIAEGVLASTVWGSWGEYAELSGAHMVPFEVAFCYLDTPVEVCLDRIRQRQIAGGKVRDIKEDLVRDKVKAVAATRRKALEAGHLVYDLPHLGAPGALGKIIRNEDWVAPLGTLAVPAREHYRASA